MNKTGKPSIEIWQLVLGILGTIIIFTSLAFLKNLLIAGVLWFTGLAFLIGAATFRKIKDGLD